MAMHDPQYALQDSSPFFSLPKELRLIIYELVLRSYKQARIGNAYFNDKELSPWPKQPSICRTCRLMRSESLSIHYSTTVFVLNVQRPSGEAMVLIWLDRMGRTSLSAFNHLKHVSVIAGLGYREPPKEYMIDVSRSRFVFATRPCAPAYLYKYYNMRLWTPLLSGALRKRLQLLPVGGASGFSAAQSVREVIAVVGDLSGCGLYGDLATLEHHVTTTAKTTTSRSLIEHSPLLSLPSEIRLAIWEYALSSSTPVTIGQRAISLKDLTGWPTYPNLTRTSRILRQESLPVYFALTHFIFNIQRTQCEEIVLDWINRCSEVYADAFKHIQHVSVIAGSGIRQPPRQYEFYMQQNKLVSTIDRPILQPYTLPANRWSPPLWEQLRQELLRMPKKGDVDFDVARNLRRVISILTKFSD